MASHLEIETILFGKLVLAAPFADPRFADYLIDNGARDVLLLSHEGPLAATRLPSHVISKYKGLRDIKSSNCEVAILNEKAVFALTKKRLFWGSRLRTVLVPFSLWSLLCAPSFWRYRRKKFIRLVGRTSVLAYGRRRQFLVLNIKEKSIDNRHVFAPPQLDNSEIFSKLAGLDYVLLRSVEKVEEDSEHRDMDLLVADADIENLHARLGEEIGTKLIDAYTESGVGGHSYQSVPYFAPKLARSTLDTAEIRPSGIRAPTEKWRYLTLAFHLIFHGKSRHIQPGTENIGRNTFIEARHTVELKNRATAAGFPEPQTFNDLDRALRDNDVFPGRDLLGFYARQNPFVTARYLTGKATNPGLATFFVRNFGLDHDLVPSIRESLQRDFTIVDEGPIDDENRQRVLSRVRGGNWNDRERGPPAEPSHWFVCLDRDPIAPTGKLKKVPPSGQYAGCIHVTSIARPDQKSQWINEVRILQAQSGQCGVKGAGAYQRTGTGRHANRVIELALNWPSLLPDQVQYGCSGRQLPPDCSTRRT